MGEAHSVIHGFLPSVVSPRFLPGPSIKIQKVVLTALPDLPFTSLLLLVVDRNMVDVFFPCLVCATRCGMDVAPIGSWCLGGEMTGVNARLTNCRLHAPRSRSVL